MEKKQIDWENLGFGYVQTEQRYVSNYKDGKWDEGGLTEDAGVVLNECAGVLQYAQTVFEGMKAYTTEDGKIVVFRPDLNAARMADSARRLEMPVFPEERFLEAVKEVVKANAAYVPPYGSGATLYIRPYMFGSNPVIGVKPADEYQFRVFVTPVGPYFKGGVKPLTLCVSDFDRAAPHGTGHIKAGLNYAMAPTGNESYFTNMIFLPGASNNYNGYDNEKVDEIAETLSTTYDKEKRVELMKEMEQEILNDGAYAFFANQKLICVYNKKVTGFEINPSEYYLITNNIDIAE